MSQFADLHCHPHMRSFNWFRHSNIENTIKYHPWYVVYTKHEKAVKGRRAFSYSQSDPILLKNGNVRLAFVSLYPMEKGWFSNTDMSLKKRLKVLRHPLKYEFNKNQIGTIINPKYIIKNDKNLASFLRGILQSTIMQIPVKRTKFLKSNYNYFKELKRERDFFLGPNDKMTTSDIFIPPLRNKKRAKKDINKYPEYYNAQGVYTVALDGEHMNRIISENKIAVVFTIEGANVFNSMGSVDKILKKIDRIRNGEEWKKTPVFFISLAHHFNNSLCGHAHSIIGGVDLLIDQKKGMNTGFTDKGWAVSRKLLNLDESYRPIENGERQILIDVKHMSARSRMNYYDKIIEPNLKRPKPIPVVASHCGYSGRPTLKELIKNLNNENNRDKIDGFNPWNINLSDEDIRLIYASGGIIGINFDQRILGVQRKHKKLDDHFYLLWNNIKAMVNVLLKSQLTDRYYRDPKDRWNLFAIGTDFDGAIDPANGYSTTLNFKDFRKKLIQRLNNEQNLCPVGLTPEAIADKVCFENAYNFTLSNFK